MKKKKILFVAFLAIVVCLLWISTQTPQRVGPEYVPKAYTSVLSLLPPIIAITLALITKEVYSSLFLGIVTGALLYSNGNILLALNTVVYNESGGLVTKIATTSNASILVFVVILGTLVALMNKSGGSYAFGAWASRHIKSKVGAQLATIALGILIFVDDGFNCMTVGNVMRPVTDRFKVSRSKLAYLLDATAAPICIIAPISSWAAAVTYSVPEDMNINGFSMFLRTIPYNFYALCTIVMMVLLVVLKFDFGKMKDHEDNANNGDLFTTQSRPYQEVDNQTPNQNGKVIDLVFPVGILIISCIIGMIYTGGFFEGVSFIDSFADCDAARGLLFGSLFTLIVTFIFYQLRDVLSFQEFMDCLPEGFRSMCAPMIILIMAWNLSGMTNLLGASIFIHDIVENVSTVKMFLPCIIFVISVFLAFSTGTSWGTFSILIPIVCSVFSSSYEMLVIAIAACLSGAVCGDHCSPISDTTIMASAGSHCEHVNHVATQLPYALTCATICAIGYLLAGILGYTFNSQLALISCPITLLLMTGTIYFLSKKTI
ncbi:MAG: Na+/H+ antiporter NhaC family protein [Firmicutes bacterium]|nr:Na+/H+ antiporter NhaC family protein [Bacillota bacterium]